MVEYWESDRSDSHRNAIIEFNQKVDRSGPRTPSETRSATLKDFYKTSRGKAIREGQLKKLSTSICPWCLESFAARGFNHRFCTTTCRVAYNKSAELNDKYGFEGYKEVVDRQKGHCSICKVYVGRGLHTDHDHVTGKLRGFICSSCNLTLGNVKDDINVLKAMIEYLSFTSTGNVFIGDV